MGGGVYFLRGDDLVAMREQEYDSEDVLQTLLAKFPALLAGDQLDGEERRWLLVGREASLPDDADVAGRWSVDHLFLDQDGVPTLVEVKRSSDTRIRREVVGQMLDYAANAVAWWPVDEVRSLFLARCAADGIDADAEVAALIGDADPEEFWQRVGANLSAGRLRLVFVADEIPRELRRVVEFLNEQMRAEVLAIEVKQYVGDGGLRTLVPRVLGQTAAAETRKRITSGSRRWDEASFFADLAERNDPSAVTAARAIYDWSKANTDRITFGRGKDDGSFIPVIMIEGRDYFPFAVYTYGRVEIQFQHMNRPPFNDLAVRDEFRLELNKITGIDFGEDVVSRRPSIRLAALGGDAAALRGFLECLDWFVKRARQ